MLKLLESAHVCGRQFRRLWWPALRRIFTEKHSNVFVYEAGVIVSSRDHACFEAQRRIGKRFHDHAVSMNASRRRLPMWTYISMSRALLEVLMRPSKGILDISLDNREIQ